MTVDTLTSLTHVVDDVGFSVFMLAVLAGRMAESRRWKIGWAYVEAVGVSLVIVDYLVEVFGRLI